MSCKFLNHCSKILRCASKNESYQTRAVQLITDYRLDSVRGASELNMEFLGLKLVRFLITKNPKEGLDQDHKTKLPGIIGRNLVKFAEQEFMKKTHNTNTFENSESLKDTNSLLLI